MPTGGVEFRDIARRRRERKDPTSQKQSSLHAAVTAAQAGLTFGNPLIGIAGMAVEQTIKHRKSIVKFGKKLYSKLKKDPREVLGEGINAVNRKQEGRRSKEVGEKADQGVSGGRESRFPFKPVGYGKGREDY